MSEEKFNVIRNYLSTEFPNYAINDRHDFDRIAQTFRLTTEDEIHLVTFSRKFLDDNSPSQLADILERSSLSKYFQQEGIARVLVTNSGIRAR
jgi:hypothetical protein